MLRDLEFVQSAVGRAESILRAGRAFLIEAMTELIAATEARGDLIQARVLLRTAGTYAAESATRIVELLAVEAGASAILETGKLERMIRDVQAATKHIAMSQSNYVAGGRLSLGLDAGVARF